MKSLFALVYLFSASFLPLEQNGITNNDVLYMQNKEKATAVEFQLGLDICDIVTVYGGERTKQTMNNIVSYSVYSQQYYCGIEAHYSFDKITLKGGMFRQCTHGLKPWNIRYENIVDSASFELYVKAEGKIPLF